MQLVALSGPLAGGKFPLPPTVTTLGADPLNHITWADGQLAPNHAQIRWQGGRHLLVDLGSASGVWVNGQRVVAPVPLQYGDRIKMGGSTFLYLATQPQPVSVPAQPPQATSPAPAPQVQRVRPIMWIVLLSALTLLAAFTLFVFPRLWAALLSPATLLLTRGWRVSRR